MTENIIITDNNVMKEFNQIINGDRISTLSKCYDGYLILTVINVTDDSEHKIEIPHNSNYPISNNFGLSNNYAVITIGNCIKYPGYNCIIVNLNTIEFWYIDIKLPCEITFVDDDIYFTHQQTYTLTCIYKCNMKARTIKTTHITN